MDDDIIKTLLKKATGYSHDEVQEEYSVSQEGEMVLTKRKVTKKYYPPDSTALKTYLELASGRELEDCSDEELVSEKKRLLQSLSSLSETEETSERDAVGRADKAIKCGKPKGDNNVKKSR